MSKKRTSAESSNDEPKNEASDSFQQDDNAIAVFQQDDNAIAVFQQDDNAIAVFQQDDNAKRAKLNPLTDTTLHDLPIEILERILLKAVVEEVNSMKLAKRVWKEKADLAISRLSTVCSQWSSILTTNFFRNELHRILDKTAQETIRLEILHQPSINVVPHDLTILKDELFVLWVEQYHDYCINVYDRNNVSEVKEIIQLPGLRPLIIAACNVSNCVYLLNRRQSTEASVLRISKDDDHQYTGSQILILPGLPKPTLSVAADGSLILSRQRDESHTVISMYNANGFWLRDMSLYTENYGLNQIIPKANGNLVLVSYRVHQHKTQITEIDLDGSVVRQYRPSDDGDYVVCLADIHGRLLITDHHPNRIQLLDPEFNLLEFHCPHLASQPVLNPLIIRFDSERMEVVACMEAIRVGLCYITVCRLVDIKK